MTSSPPVRTVPAFALAPVAGVGGLLASLAFQPFNAWPLAFVAVALFAWAIGRTGGVRAAAMVGWTFGLFFMATSLIWQTEIMVASYAGLTLLTSAVYLLIGILVRLGSPLRAAPLWAAGAWSVGEWVISVFPFDGFGWMRLGYSQLDSPLAGFYPLTGAASVSFLVALVGHLLAWLVERPAVRRAAVVGGTVVGLAAAGFAGIVGVPAAQEGEWVNVGWVQPGAPGGGVYGLGPARTITYNSRDETGRLLARVAAGEQPRPDFIVWPENSTDMDPRRDRPTYDAVLASVEGAAVPILVGSIYNEPERDERQTVALWWTGRGVQQLYAKRNLVPFGEWVPFRDVLLPLIPPLAYVGAQSVPGTEPGVLHVTLPDRRSIGLGVAICYEVIFPETLYDAVDAGAQLMVVQSSNAMYQGTIQIDQQFAATRVRAAEMRREVLVVTTSGLSGLVGTKGEVVDVQPSSVGVSGVQALPLRESRTPVLALGRWVELALVVQGAVGGVLGLLARRRAGANGTMEGNPRTGE